MKVRARMVIAICLSLGAVACIDVATSPTGAGRPTAAARFDTQSSPQLLLCATTQTQQVTGVIGLLGGVLSLGATQVAIPAGAVLQPTLFEIDIPASQYMEVDIHAVGLSTFIFQQPVNITIDYSRCNPSAVPAGAQLEGAYIDTQTYAVLQQMGGINDTIARSITFPTGHLSGYAVAY